MSHITDWPKLSGGEVPDPYVKVGIERGEQQGTFQETKALNNTLLPDWNESFVLALVGADTILSVAFS